MTIESDIFPVTSSDADVGTTLRLYYFQGTDVADYGNDESSYASDLSEYSTATTQMSGYGDAINSDGVDKGRLSGAYGRMLVEGSANTTHTNTTAMTIESISVQSDWFNTGWVGPAGTMKLTTPYYGWEVYYGYTGNPFRFMCRHSSIGYKYANTSFSPSDTDWVYVCAVWDSTQVGDDQIELYCGNLTTPDADLTAKASVTSTGNALEAYSIAMPVMGRSDGSFTRPNHGVSVLRIQDKAFSSAVAEARFDEIKAWTAAGGGVGRLIGGGLVNAGLVGGRLT
jgi:hypothetical protein